MDLAKLKAFEHWTVGQLFLLLKDRAVILRPRIEVKQDTKKAFSKRVKY